MLSLRERSLEEEARGEAKKSAVMAKKLKELQRVGLDANEILRILTAAYTPQSQPSSV